LSQNDIYDLLKGKRLMGDDSFFSARKIGRLLGERGCCNNPRNVSTGLRCLRDFGYLEIRGLVDRSSRFSYCSYRLKKRYC
jgi:hypothetical protein